MKKILASLLAITMLMTTMSGVVIPASADNSGVATALDISEEIFTETFEDYTKDENWLDNITDSYVTSEKTGVTAKDWFIYDGTSGKDSNKTKVYQGAANAEIMVVDAGTAGLESDGVDRGQVLKIYGGSGEAKDLTLRRTVENITNMGTLGNYGSATSGYGATKYIAASNFLKASAGKKLVYEVKYYAPADFYSSQANLMSLATAQNTTAGYTGGGGILVALSGKNAYLRSMGDDEVSHYARAHHFDDRDGAWHTIKVVADYSAAANKDYWHTSRLYLDGKLVSSRYTLDPVSGAYLEGSASYVNANKTNGTEGDEIYDFAPYSRVPTAETETDTDSKMKLGETHGWYFGAKNSTSYDGKALYYVDDLKAYWIDALEIGEAVNTENYKTGEIQIPFNSQIKESVTKYNPQYVSSTSNSSGYNSVTRFGERYKDETTKTLAEVADSTKALITIVDSDGKLVEGAVKSVSLSSDKMTVLVTPDMTKLSGNTTYKIAIDPMFCDIYGQALTGKTAATAVTNYVPFITASAEFTARVDKTSISATEGDEITATVTLSEVATEADIANAFTVTNTETEAEVTTGWEYTLSADGTKVELDFSDLTKGSYKLTMNEFVASGKLLTNASEIVVSIVIAEKLATDPLFNETFEDYEKDVNWLDNLSGDYVTSENTGVTDNDWYVSSSYTGATDAQIMVVNAEEKGLGTGRGQVLMIDGGNTTTTMLSLRKALNNITKLGTVTDSKISYANFTKESAGKKLVYEVEYFVPGEFYSGEAHFMTLSAAAAPAQYVAGTGGIYSCLSGKYTHMFANTGSSKSTYYSRAYQNFDDRGSWHTLKIVADFSKQSEATYWNTARIYYDGKLLTGNYTAKTTDDTNIITPDAPYELGDNIYDFANSSTPTSSRAYPSRFSDIYGWVFSAKNSTSYNGKAVYYIDNFKAYLIDELEVESMDNAENYVNGDIQINFNSEIKQDVEKFAPAYSTSYVQSRYKLTDLVTKNYKDLIYVVDESGNKVEGALSDIRLSDNKRTLIVTPDMNVLWGGRTYKIAIDPLFSDVFGQAFTGNTTSQPKTTYVEFKTAKNDSLSIGSATAADLSVDGKVSTTIELSNVAGSTKTAFLAVAVYNKDFEMIGIYTQDVTAPNGTTPVAVTVDIGDYTASDVASVKAHLWNSFADMIPYQAEESIGL